MDGDPAVESELDSFSLTFPLPYRVAFIVVLGMELLHCLASLCRRGVLTKRHFSGLGLGHQSALPVPSQDRCSLVDSIPRPVLTAPPTSSFLRIPAGQRPLLRIRLFSLRLLGLHAARPASRAGMGLAATYIPRRAARVPGSPPPTHDWTPTCGASAPSRYFAPDSHWRNRRGEGRQVRRHTTCRRVDELHQGAG